MDQIIPRILRFDRFALDLTRGCVRIGGEDIDLRPKPFEVLRYLAENAGRLVSKQELFEAVWPNVVVTDDSLVQCIGDLREKLGDLDHRLIKTVPRRGYLLNATGTVSPPLPPALDRPAAAPATLVPGDPRPSRHPVSENLSHVWGAAAAVLLFTGMLVATYLLGRVAQPAQPLVDLAAITAGSPSPASRLFTESDAKRVAELAEQKLLPLPAFQIERPAADVPDTARRFVGIWVSDKGWMGSNRQLMAIITNVDRDGVAAGFIVHGPPQAGSRVQSPPHYGTLKGRIAGETLIYRESTSEFSASFTPQNQLWIAAKFPDGSAGWVLLNSSWTLVEAEHAALTGTAAH